VRLLSAPLGEVQAIALHAYHKAYVAAAKRRWRQAAEHLAACAFALKAETLVMDFHQHVIQVIAHLDQLLVSMRGACERLEVSSLQAALAEVEALSPVDGEWLADARQLQQELQVRLGTRAEARIAWCAEAQGHQSVRRWSEALACWNDARQLGSDAIIERGIADCTARLGEVDSLVAQIAHHVERVDPYTLTSTLQRLAWLLPSTDERLREWQSKLLPQILEKREALELEIYRVRHQLSLATSRRQWEDACRQATSWVELSPHAPEARKELQAARAALQRWEHMQAELTAALVTMELERVRSLHRQFVQLAPEGLDASAVHSAVAEVEQACARFQRMLEDARGATEQGEFASADAVLATLARQVPAGPWARATAHAKRHQEQAMQRRARRMRVGMYGVSVGGVVLALLVTWWQVGVARVIPQAQALVSAEPGWQTASDQDLGALLRDRGLPPAWLPFRHWASARVVQTMKRTPTPQSR
jgi:hypothetical protein